MWYNAMGKVSCHLVLFLSLPGTTAGLVEHCVIAIAALPGSKVQDRTSKMGEEGMGLGETPSSVEMWQMLTEGGGAPEVANALPSQGGRFCPTSVAVFWKPCKTFFKKQTNHQVVIFNFF